MSQLRSRSTPILGGRSFTFSRSQRGQPDDEFWVRLSPKSDAGSTRSPSASSASRLMSLSSSPSSASSRPSTPCSRRSRSSSAASSAEAPGPRVPPAKELVPPFIKEKVLSLGSPVVAIEMNWSSSGYLPAHRDGQKYRWYVDQVREMLAGRGVEVVGFMTPDDRKVKKQARRMRIYDRFSEWERDLPESVASNQSNVLTGPSRLGAFEVHVVQDAWYPALCPGQLQPGEKHQGGAAVLSDGIYCTGCAKAKVGQVPSSTSDQACLDSQHALLHSKLWSRRWPALRALLIQIGILTIGPPPELAHPVPPEVEMPTRLEELCAEPLEFDPIPLPELPEVPKAPPEPSIGGAPPSPQRPEFSENELLIRWALARLDCPANFGWSVVGQGADELLCRCGGGSHQLNMTSVTNILAPLGYSKDVFRSHVGRTRSKYVQRNMIELVNGFLQEHAGQKPENLEEVASQVGAAIEAEEMFTKTTSEKFCLHVEQEKAEKGDKRYQSELQKYRGLQEQYEGKMEMERRRLKAEWEQACKYRKQVEATRKDIQAKMDDMREHQRRLTHRQQEICEAFPKAVEKGWEEAFVDHVLSLAELVTGFPRQERRSVEEADDAIQAARGVNEEHRQAWENWRTRWSDVPEVLKTVAQAEPKVSAEEKARMEESVRSAASALRADFATKISAVVPERRAFFEAKLEEVTRQWKEVGGR